jgi:hypothetical protein
MNNVTHSASILKNVKRSWAKKGDRYLHKLFFFIYHPREVFSFFEGDISPLLLRFLKYSLRTHFIQKFAVGGIPSCDDCAAINRLMLLFFICKSIGPHLWGEVVVGQGRYGGLLTEAKGR